MVHCNVGWFFSSQNRHDRSISTLHIKSILPLSRDAASIGFLQESNATLDLSEQLRRAVNRPEDNLDSNLCTLNHLVNPKLFSMWCLTLCHNLSDQSWWSSIGQYISNLHYHQRRRVKHEMKYGFDLTQDVIWCGIWVFVVVYLANVGGSLSNKMSLPRSIITNLAWNETWWSFASFITP